LHCEQEEKKLADLRRKRMLEEAILQHCVSKDAEYIKFTKFIEERVLSGNDKKESGEIRFAAADDKLQHYKLFNLFLWSMAAN
jgi:hypothetical protein